jgi:hypothetical protein
MARRPRNRLYAAGALVVLAALIFGLVRVLAPTTSATITYSDAAGGPVGITDAASVSASNLSAPPSGQTYYAWLLDTAHEGSQILGPMTQHGDTYTVSFSAPGGNGHSATNLLGQGYNKIEVTQEPSQGAPVRWPDGTVKLQAAVPTQAFTHIGHLLSAFPSTPKNQGFLVGLQDQTQQLDAQAQALQVAVKNGTSSNLVNTCYAQSIVDIIEGSSGPSYAQLPNGCAAQGITTTGDGYGILGKDGYTAGASDHANLAATAPDATSAVKTHADNVETAVKNIDDWVSDADHAAWWLTQHPDDTSGVSGLVTAADSAYHGHATGDQPVRPISGEAGAQTAYTEGQQMATLTLTLAK